MNCSCFCAFCDDSYFYECILQAVRNVKGVLANIKVLKGIPGVRCPKCIENGHEEWVIRGKVCPKCGTVCQ